VPTQLPSGRWRPRVRHPRTGKHINPQAVIGGPVSYKHEADARSAEHEARAQLRQNARLGVTAREFHHEWTTDPLWLRPAESTNLHNAERTAGFVARYGDRPIRGIGAPVVAEWLKGGRNLGTVQLAARDVQRRQAASEAGRLVITNPFAGLRLRSARGRKRRAAAGAR
jgi:hypothetical protein